MERDFYAFPENQQAINVTVKFCENKEFGGKWNQNLPFHTNWYKRWCLPAGYQLSLLSDSKRKPSLLPVLRLRLEVYCIISFTETSLMLSNPGVSRSKSIQ